MRSVRTDTGDRRPTRRPLQQVRVRAEKGLGKGRGSGETRTERKMLGRTDRILWLFEFGKCRQRSQTPGLGNQVEGKVGGDTVT